MKKLSDTQLALLTATTDSHKAYSELVRRHRSALLAFLYRIAGDDMNIEDLVQSTFIKALQKIVQFRSDASFKTWLFRIGYNEFLQLKRRRKSRDQMETNLADYENQKNTLPVDLSVDLKRALDQLSDLERVAIILCDAVGFSNHEAAHAMDAPLGSVKTYIKRARQKMRTYLEGDN